MGKDQIKERPNEFQWFIWSLFAIENWQVFFTKMFRFLTTNEPNKSIFVVTQRILDFGK